MFDCLIFYMALYCYFIIFKILLNSFLFVDELVTGSYHAVKLCGHDGELSNGSELAADYLVHKVAEGVVVFLFVLWFLGGQLKLAWSSSHVVDHNIIG